MGTSRTTDLVEAIGRAQRRLAHVLGDAPDPGPVVPHNGEWTVRDLLAHLVTVTSRYTPAGNHSERWADRPDQIAALNDAEIDALGGQAYPVLLHRLDAAVAALAHGPELDAADPMPYTGGTLVHPADLLGILLGEFLVHGRDLAQVLGRPWEIGTEDAVRVLTALAPIMPAWVDPDGARGLTAVFEVRLRGHQSYWWNFTDGALTVERSRPAERVDVTFSADPVALLLTSYRRVPLWKPILGGKLRAWGRRGHLAFAVNSYFRAP